MKGKEMTDTYRIVRFWQDDRGTEVVVRGLTREQAQAHCQRDDTRGTTGGVAWFDGFEKED